MKFDEYLRKCRENSSLTQEQLVHALYSHDIGHFETLKTSTLSKWERGVTKPKAAKQLSIIRYFQHLTGKPLPCFENYTAKDAEEQICRVGMQNLLGNSKKLILDFPSSVICTDDLMIYQLRNTEMLDRIIDINVGLDKDFNKDLTQLESEHFKEWALHPSNSFYICLYKEQFFGLLFTLKLKPEPVEKIMSMEIDERDLSVEDFATFYETGSSYMLSFFALNEKAISLLFIRYFAHLIANQDVIEEVGVATMMEDTKKLIRNMNLYHYDSKAMTDGLVLQTYRETLFNFLASEYAVKMLLSKQECPEE